MLLAEKIPTTAGIFTSSNAGTGILAQANGVNGVAISGNTNTGKAVYGTTSTGIGGFLNKLVGRDTHFIPRAICSLLIMERHLIGVLTSDAAGIATWQELPKIAFMASSTTGLTIPWLNFMC